MDIKDVFAQLGLKEDHLKIYLASLEWGETTISNLAYKSRLPRTSIYQLIEVLVDKGIITQILRERKKTYLPTDPEYLVTLLQKHKIDVENLIIEDSEIKEIKDFYLRTTQIASWLKTNFL